MKSRPFPLVISDELREHLRMHGQFQHPRMTITDVIIDAIQRQVPGAGHVPARPHDQEKEEGEC